MTLIGCITSRVSVGGQLPASLIYTVEMRPKVSSEKYQVSTVSFFPYHILSKSYSLPIKIHWGYYGSLVMMTAICGTLLGNLVGAFMRTTLTDEQLLSWGWRIPFLSGILIAFVAMYLRQHGEEHHPNAGEYDDDDEEEKDGNGIFKEKQTESKHLLSEVFRRENLPALGAATLTPMLWGKKTKSSVIFKSLF